MPHTNCSACPLRVQPLFIPFNPAELAFMQKFKTGEMQVLRGKQVLIQGETSPRLFTVMSGMGTRSVMLHDGRRQVINFVFPGDLLGLQAGLLGEAKHSVTAATPMVLCVFARDGLWELFRNQPERAYDLTWIGAVEEHFLGETIASLGQRNAQERMAWALLRIWRRLAAVGLAKEGAVPLPFRQQELADALGLSLVHTNKTVARLRHNGLAIWQDGQLRIPDKDALADVAGVEDQREDRRPIL